MDIRNTLTGGLLSTFAAAIVKVLYGVDVAGKDDRYIALMEKTLEAADAFTPGAYMVEYLPFLRYVPAWVPGAGFQRFFAELRHAAHEVRDALPAKTKEGMVNPPRDCSFVERASLSCV